MATNPLDDAEGLLKAWAYKHPQAAIPTQSKLMYYAASLLDGNLTPAEYDSLVKQVLNLDELQKQLNDASLAHDLRVAVEDAITIMNTIKGLLG